MPSERSGQYDPSFSVQDENVTKKQLKRHDLSPHDEIQGRYECFYEPVAEDSRLIPFLSHPLAIISHI